MPNLLVAPSSHAKPADAEEVELYEEYETGYYEDGAYAALPDLSSTPAGLDHEDEDEEDIDPQEAYYASLKDRFCDVRTVLHSSPPTPSPVKRHNENSSASAQASFLHNATHQEWRYQILHTAPSMRLLASMHQDGVIQGLGRLETLLPKRDLLAEIQGHRIGVWGWGLLGRCREIGEMGSKDVGVLRTLGKTALRMGKKLQMQKRGGVGALHNAEADAGGDEDDGEEHEEVPQRVVNDAESFEKQEVPDGQIGTEIEEGEVDETDIVADPPDRSDRNGNVHVPVLEGDKPDARVTGRWPGQDIHTNTALDTLSIEPSIPHTRRFDGLAQYGQAKDALALAKESLLARVTSPAPSASSHDMNSRPEDGSERTADVEAKAFATLDMIVTIVGEFYGQKDLLDAREAWGE